MVGSTDDMTNLGGGLSERRAGEFHFQVIDRTTTVALTVAIPLARLGLDRKVQILAAVNKTSGTPFRSLLFQRWCAGSVVGRNFAWRQ